MPNHVANRITSQDLDLIRRMLRSKDRVVDFNRLIPMPEGLEVEPHMGIISMAKRAMLDMPDVHADGIVGVTNMMELTNIRNTPGPLTLNDEHWGMFIQCLQNKRNHGEYYWYDWAPKHWGTKWNAYSIEERPDALYFETAWACPEPIVHALAEAGLDFVWEYADEDYGRNFGIWTCVGGELALTQPDGNGEEWGMRLHGMDNEAIKSMREEQE